MISNHEHRIIINSDGEIIKEVNAGDRIKIIPIESIQYLESLKDKLVPVNEGEDFIKVYVKPLEDMKNVLTGAESIFMNYLMYQVSYQTGILMHSNGKFLTRSTMAYDTGHDIRNVDRLLDSLVKKQVLSKHITGRSVCFLCNPYIFMKGSKVNKTLQKLFENTRWAKLYRKE